MQRLAYHKIVPDAYQKLLDWHTASKGTVDPVIRELVLIRCSQLNRCLFCLDLHTREARKAGETEQRLNCLPAWREAVFYTKKEKAALLWAEALTGLTAHEVSDSLYDLVKKEFSDREFVDLTMLICSINSFNRLGVAFQPAVKGDQ